MRFDSPINLNNKSTRIISFLLLFTAAFFCRAFSAQDPNYAIQPTDVLAITVYQQPDLTTKTRVSADGYISFPLLGKVEVTGLSAEQLEQNLKRLLEQDYLVNAQVSVFIEQYHPRQVTVIGEVTKPGKYDMAAEKKMTVMEAIALAGGFTKDAAINETMVLRTENGKQKAIKVRVKNITLKGRTQEDVILEPGDIVTVPESFF